MGQLAGGGGGMNGSEGSSPIASGMKFSVTILAGFVSALVAIALIGVATYWSVKDLLRNGDRTARSHQVIDHLEALHFLLNEAETRERDYLITGDRYNLELYRSAIGEIAGEVHSLETLIGNRGDQQRRLKAILPLINARLMVLKDSIDVREQMGPESALEMIRSSSRRSLMDDIGRRIDDMIDEERLALTNRRQEETRTAKPAIHIVVAGCVVGSVVLFLTAFYLFRGLGTLRARLSHLSGRDVALQTQSLFMDAVLGSMDEGVVVLDRDMKVVHSNPVADQLLRASKTRVVEELKAKIEPASAGEGLTLALEHLQTALPAGDSETTQLSLSSPDKPAQVAIAANVRVLRDESGALQGGVLLLRDITASKRMERQSEANDESLISMFHYGLEAAFITTAEDSLCVGVNEGLLALCGYSREEILGHTIEELNFCDSPTELIDILEHVRHAKIVSERVLCFRTRPGRTFEAVLSAMPIEVGGQPCILSALHNITWPKVEWAAPRLIGKLTSELG
jgi:PAS domain S-box-containing protein